MAADSEKAIYIQKNLSAGKNREEVAAMLGYKSWRCLDIYMRRSGCRWNSKKNIYEKLQESKPDCPDEYIPSKIAGIISMFGCNNAEPMEIAKAAGFRDHRELSEYMQASGFIWSPEKSNYIRKQHEDAQNEKPDTGMAEKIIGSFNNDGDISDNQPDKYMDFLITLYKHREQLFEAILPQTSQTIVPRYTIPGLTRTKSFCMSELLSRLVADFSQSMNISQREIVEGAVIEFLRKYSFRNQVDSLLRRVTN